MNKYIVSIIASSSFAFSLVNAAEVITTADSQVQLNLTIYNSNVALVKDTRDIDMSKGSNILVFKDVSASIQPETAILKAKKVNLLEQNFEYDLLSERSLLNKYVGKKVTIETTNPKTGEVKEEKATVLANNRGAMLKIGNKIRGINKNMSIIYDKLPNNLRDKPTLVMHLDNQGKKDQRVELNYLTSRIGWKANYVANLVDDKRLDIKGWITLNNNTGTTYKNANLQLVAGDVNRVQSDSNYNKPIKLNAFKSRSNAIKQEGLFEYHLYTLGFPTTIKNKEQKQVSLIESYNVPYQKKLIVNSSNLFDWQDWSGSSEYVDLPVNVNIIINNKKDSNLGIAMPAGIVRAYKNDSKGNMQFIGEDRINHTPENKEISLRLGKSFYVTAKSKQVSFNKKSLSKKKHVITSTYEVVFKNAKNISSKLNYRQSFSGNWKIIKQSFKSKKLNSSVNSWAISIPARGETTLTYTVRTYY